MALLDIQDVSLRFGGIRALIGVSLSVEPGELYAIIGPNGAGKTSLVNCISGSYRPDKGVVVFRRRDITCLRSDRVAGLGIARTFQNVALFSNMNVIDNMLLGRHNHFSAGFFKNLLLGYLGRDESVQREKVEEVIEFLEMERWREQIVSSLPYGVQKRVELGRALAQEPKLLLLDEPMAGMNLEETEDMARFIMDIHEELGTTIVMIEHDMNVVMNLSQRVAVLEFGRLIAEGSPDEVAKDPEVQRAYLGQIGEEAERARGM
jgi:branched-chain amino acid transport system ATP-binding protein